MTPSYRLLPALAMLFVGCASNPGTHVGEDADSDIRTSLTNSTVRESVLLDGNRAYWIGPKALEGQTRALLEALSEAPALGFFPDSKGSMMTLNSVPADEVIGFRHTSEILDLGLEGGGVSRVIRMTGDRIHYELWMQVAGDLKFTPVGSTPAVEAAWRGLAQGAARRSEKLGGTPYARQFRGWPLESNLGAVTMEVVESGE